MKKNNIIYLFMISLLIFFASCKEEEFVYEGPFNVQWVETNVDFPLNGTKEVAIRLDALGQTYPITVGLTFTAVGVAEGEEYTVDKKEITFEEGVYEHTITFTGNDTYGDDGANIKIEIASVTGGRNLEINSSRSTITINAISPIVEEWTGEYNWEGDGWSRTAELTPVEGETHKFIMTGFWGSSEELPCTIDASNPDNIRITVPSGTMLDPGWDAEGAWWFSEDLIGVMDRETNVITFTQFSYKTDAGTEGTFPWCATTCTMTKIVD